MKKPEEMSTDELFKAALQLSMMYTPQDLVNYLHDTMQASLAESIRWMDEQGISFDTMVAFKHVWLDQYPDDEASAINETTENAIRWAKEAGMNRDQFIDYLHVVAIDTVLEGVNSTLDLTNAIAMAKERWESVQ